MTRKANLVILLRKSFFSHPYNIVLYFSRVYKPRFSIITQTGKKDLITILNTFGRKKILSTVNDAMQRFYQNSNANLKCLFQSTSPLSLGLPYLFILTNNKNLILFIYTLLCLYFVRRPFGVLTARLNNLFIRKRFLFFLIGFFLNYTSQKYTMSRRGFYLIFLIKIENINFIFLLN